MAENESLFFTNLADALFVGSKPLSPADLLQKLRSEDSIRPALEKFYLILKRGIEAAQSGLQSWNESQIQAACAIASAIASASRSLSLEQAEPLIVAVVQQSLEFAISFLEKSEFNGDDSSIQNKLVQLLEIALADGMDKVSDLLQPSSVNSLIDLLPMVADYCVDIDLHNHSKCSLQGISCSVGGKPLDQLHMTLASECIQPDRPTSGSNAHAFHQDLNKLIFLSQHWAVAHVGCIPRLILLCKELIVIPDMFDEKMVGADFSKRLSFSLRILKLLGSLTKDIPYVEYDAQHMQAVASFVDVLPSLFRPGFEFVNSHAAVEGSFESLILLLLEEFLQLVQVIFCNRSVYQNIQACIVASMLDNLDSSVWRYNKSAANVKPPLAFFPCSTLYILKLIHDLKRQTHKALNWEEFEKGISGSSDLPIDSPYCHVHFEKVPLLKRCTVEELFKMILPSSNQWVDNLMHLIFFLHSEGVKLKPKVERSSSSCAKTSSTSELENSVCNEDEALFGNLFSESGRSVGSTDGYDQPPVAISSSSGHSNMPIQAATEMLSFLEANIFSPEWLPSVYEDGCKQIRRDHIDVLLSLLNCQGCCSEDRISDSSGSLHEEKKNGSIHELCFELLHNLLTRHALSDSLEEYLVEKILNVGNDIFVYNDQTLTLLAHTLFCRVGLAGSLFRNQIYKGFVGFVVEKAKAICFKCPSLKELLGTLPSVFHIEILLMAFHLSSEGEKTTLVNLIFTSLRTIDVPTSGFNSTQLSCWALIVSRLILVLRHMIFNPHTCPSSLLLDLRSKLREAPLSVSRLPSIMNDHISSWASVVVNNLAGAYVEEPLVSSLINQLIDISAPTTSLYRNDQAIDGLCLKWNDIFSTLSRILGFWKGKKAAAIEDLVVERYVFALCWDYPTMATASDKLLPLCTGPQDLDFSDMVQFFFFAHSFLGQCGTFGEGTNFPRLVVGLLEQLSAVPILEEIEELDFCRPIRKLS